MAYAKRKYYKRSRRTILPYRKRQTDKIIGNLSLGVPHTTVVGGNAIQVLHGPVTFPCTYTGLRIKGQMYDNISGGGSPTGYVMGVVIQRQGTALSTINIATGPLYQPEQDLLAWQCGSCEATTNELAMDHIDMRGSSRRLQPGDQIVLVVRVNNQGATGGNLQFNGTMQAYVKI